MISLSLARQGLSIEDLVSYQFLLDFRAMHFVNFEEQGSLFECSHFIPHMAEKGSRHQDHKSSIYFAFQGSLLASFQFLPSSPSHYHQSLRTLQNVYFLLG